jgi:hypothetical protein
MKEFIGSSLLRFFNERSEQVRVPHTNILGTKTRTSAVLFYSLAKEIRTKQGECGALVVKEHISSPLYRLRPLPAVPLVVRRRYLIVVPRLLSVAPRRYLFVPRPLPAAPLVVHHS